MPFNRAANEILTKVYGRVYTFRISGVIQHAERNSSTLLGRAIPPLFFLEAAEYDRALFVKKVWEYVEGNSMFDTPNNTCFIESKTQSRKKVYVARSATYVIHAEYILSADTIG